MDGYESWNNLCISLYPLGHSRIQFQLSLLIVQPNFMIFVLTLKMLFPFTSLLGSI